MEPEIDMSCEDSVKVSLRFNKIGKTSGVGIGFSETLKKNDFNLGCVTKRKNEWIQKMILNPKSGDLGHEKISD